MASFFKKALSVFVEFDENQNQDTSASINSSPNFSSGVSPVKVSKDEAEKFEKYFDRLFDQANLPGPDYFEFYKMMETLEAHIHDENARFSATFASLNIQGLTKQTLIDTANKYKDLLIKDKTDFELALNNKLKQEVGQRQKELQDLEQKIVADSEQIQKLTKEITDSQILIGKLKTDISEEENKLSYNSSGYQLASQAIINKITTDIQKIQSIL